MANVKNTQTVHLFAVTTDWTRLASGYAYYINNGNVDIYLQRQKSGTPLSTDEGVRIRPGGRFVTNPGEDDITFLRTLAGTGQVAKYEDLNNGAGTTAIVDPVTGATAMINASGQLHVVLRGEIDTANSSNAPLGAGETFTGEAVNTLDYAVVNVSVFSDVASAIDGLRIEQSCDGVHWDVDDVYTIPANTGKTFSIQAACKYYRIRYTNGAAPQTAFRLSSLLKKSNTKPSSHRIQDSIISDDDAELVKAVLTGETPRGDFANFKATRNGNFKVAVEEYGDTPSIDAFSRLRVSNPYTLFDSKQLHDKSPLFWDESLGGSATSTHSAIHARTRLAVTANAADFAIRQTKMRMNYQPGKALRHGEPVLTPCGWVNIENVKINDIVFDGNGKQTKVVGVYPQGERDIYRLEFTNGTFIDCDKSHLWKTIIRQGKNKNNFRVLSVEEMIKEYGETPPVFARWRIPCSPILQFKTQHVEIDPYTMGCILGDGHIGKNGFVVFTTVDYTILDRIKCNLITPIDYHKHFGLTGLSKPIKAMSLDGKICHNKFVPKKYLYNSEDVRFNILAGLLDTDGTIDPRDSCVSYTTVSKQLADDVAFLARSLGGLAKISIKKAGYKNKNGEYVKCKDAYQVAIRMPINPFKLERKKLLWEKVSRICSDVFVKHIKYIGRYEATCIRVESKEHTFITKDHIVTHNSQLVYFTFFNQHVDGLIKRVGLFDGTGTNNLTPNNGIFFETNDGISWNIAKNGTITERILQADWNVDTLDGSGDENNPSGLLLNDNVAQIGIIDFEWLGVGRVRVGFVIGGIIVYTHYFNHANIAGYDSVYMSSPNLPLRYDIQSDGTAAGLIDHICSSVMSEGGREDNGVVRYASTAGTHVDANVENTIYAVIGIRLKSDYKDVSVKLLNAALQIQTAGHKLEWILKFNPTVAGTFTYADQTDSAVQIARGALANTVTGGYDITGGFIESGGQQLGSAGSGERGIENAILLGSKIDGTMDTIVLCARPIAGSTNVDIEGVLSWRELT